MDEQRTENMKTGLWVLGRTATRNFFGRLKDYKTLTDKTRENVYGTIKNNSALTFDLVLDHFSPIRPVPILKDGKYQLDPNNPGQPLTGIGRESITTNFEFLVEPCTIPIWGIETLVFVEEMGSRDKKLAESSIEDALSNIAGRRAMELGIVTPTTSDVARVSRLPDDKNGAPHFKLDLR
jgi:hypothetical protein